MDQADAAKRAEEHWDGMKDARQRMATRIRWNESPRIVREQNRWICGKPLDGENAGLIDLFRQHAGAALPLARAVSVGCGAGAKEMQLIIQGVVQHFDLYDISSGSLAHGKQIAREWGVEDKVKFVHANAFEKFGNEKYDLVYWDNALHHMFDADAALKWSYDILRPGGWLLMTDFVGANRFQFSDEAIAAANSIRDRLDDRFFVNPVDPDTPFERRIRRSTLLEMEYDPSEAADSEAIVPSLEKRFPGVLIKHVGGTIYHMGLNDVLTHIPEESELLGEALKLDEEHQHIPHYAVAIAQKPTPWYSRLISPISWAFSSNPR